MTAFPREWKLRKRFSRGRFCVTTLQNDRYLVAITKKKKKETYCIIPVPTAFSIYGPQFRSKACADVWESMACMSVGLSDLFHSRQLTAEDSLAGAENVNWPPDQRAWKAFSDDFSLSLQSVSRCICTWRISTRDPLRARKYL
ncbi:hypothetical protein AVEN_202651-1 [Araneus ventricosus]|uniref:Uncharacterized protein n=1 Tax=Araneus ventricosus TaxID=182803 RepID=A0A4Y2VV15_ARAVE|nr:hypothetical protein AVEN_202651-1 [Araneus ventricosus]